LAGIGPLHVALSTLFILPPVLGKGFTASGMNAAPDGGASHLAGHPYWVRRPQAYPARGRPLGAPQGSSIVIPQRLRSQDPRFSMRPGFACAPSRGRSDMTDGSGG